MKSLKYIFIGVAGVLAFNSCADLTSPTQSEFDESVTFSNVDLADNAINGIYTVFGETNGHRGRYLPYYGLNTDVECWQATLDAGKTDPKVDVVYYDFKSNNSEMNKTKDPYASMFSAIERANLCVRGLEKYGNESTAPLLGEALCARALLYADLLKAYGEVPARFEPVSPETIYLNKADRDVIYRQLLVGENADLVRAIALLPSAKNTKHVGRMSKEFAAGLYARLALAASGYALRPDEGKVGTGDPGTVRKSYDEALQVESVYPVALEYLKDVIENSGLQLEADYETLWQGVNNLDMTPGKEILYCYPFSNGRGRWNYSFAVRALANTKLAASNGNKGGSAGPTPVMYYKYDKNDQRRDVSVVNYEWQVGETGDIQALAKPMNWYFGKFRFEWMKLHPYSGGNDDGVKPVYMRYSDILLMAAEIENELNGPTEFAKDCFLQVRKRAFRGHEDMAEAYVNALGSKEEFFEAIVDERALEFCGEMLRKGDLIRWNRLSSALAKVKDEVEQMHKREGIFAELPEYVYYRYDENGKMLTYGLQLGEIGDPRISDPNAGWVCYANSEGADSKYFSDPTKDLPESYSKRMNQFVKPGVDPDTRQWWPIVDENINNGQGYLKNDYGY